MEHLILTNNEFDTLDPHIQAHYAALVSQLVKGSQQTRFYDMFPDEHILDPATGEILIYARRLYPKHLEWFDASREYTEIAMIAANRIGKTVAGAFATTCHTTGEYPKWWTGRVFKEPVKWWVCGKTNKTTRDIVQDALFGPITYENNRKVFAGTGMIPGKLLGRPTWNRGSEDLADTCRVRHVPTGGWSTIGIKSYEQGRGAFEGTAQHGIWFDEEVPEKIYGEGLIRTMTTNGLILVTFTPLEGMTPVVQSFQPKGERAQIGGWAA